MQSIAIPKTFIALVARFCARDSTGICLEQCWFPLSLIVQSLPSILPHSRANSHRTGGRFSSVLGRNLDVHEKKNEKFSDYAPSRCQIVQRRRINNFYKKINIWAINGKAHKRAEIERNWLLFNMILLLNASSKHVGSIGTGSNIKICNFFS